MYLERKISSLLKKHQKSFLLLGARQTGKSTLIRSLRPQAEVNLADEETFVRFLRDPGLIKKVSAGKKTVFVDEVQRIPSILNTIQTLIDQKNGSQFYLSGSSARKLKRGHANLLPGRILTYELSPLSLSELQEDFDLEASLRTGLLPGIYFEKQRDLAEKTLKSYAITYLKEEIQAEALTRNLAGFSRFFDIVLSRNTEFIDFEKFSSQAAIERTSARRYFEILQDTLVLTSVEAFTKSSRRRLIQHPRFYVFDVGVLNGALQNFEASSDRRGMLFETLFLQLLQAELKSRDIDYKISVYRTEAGAEVDFILEMKRQIYAIEVKSTKVITSKDLRGLKSFKDFFGKKHHSILIYTGHDEMRIDDTEILPLKEGLQRILEEQQSA